MSLDFEALGKGQKLRIGQEDLDAIKEYQRPRKERSAQCVCMKPPFSEGGFKDYAEWRVKRKWRF